MRVFRACLVAVVATLAPGVRAQPAAPVPPAPADTAPHEFIDDAKALLVVGACAEGTAPIKAEVYEAHCKKIRAAQQDYKAKWLVPAGEFFHANVPANIPKTVVYPFAGGDLATALTVFPDADEITTISLEPAGDPRALTRLGDKRLRAPLAIVETELSSLYRYNYSKTMNMIDAMRVGQLPTQLIFSLSALATHDYEPTAMRYFELTPDGDIRYLTDTDLTKLDKIKDPRKLNTALSNVELRFRKPGGREQVYRHIMANLEDAHLKKAPAVLNHLIKKGRVSAMTKAASYLLTFNEFKTMRTYLADHVDWMVSDSTGLPPAQGTAAGFEYETWGTYEVSNMKEGASVTPSWKKLYAAQPKRPLAFRFGYPDAKLHNHLIIMRKPAS
ncbi:MAG: hypothetical protein JWO36_1701 [Myxococcales bacterium]|nr:hypothetical protein [Myxococcales bacterium]